MKRLALGKGLEALIPAGIPGESVSGGTTGKNVIDIPVDRIKPNRFQPRESFDPDRLAELAESIKEKGMIQPVIVRRENDSFELIVGERRLRAVEKLGWNAIPALIIDDIDRETIIEMTIIENLQREDLNPVEEANAYHRLMSECNLSAAEVASRIGKDRSSVANTLRLLSLPEELKQMLVDAHVSSGHARALLAVTSNSEKMALAQKTIRENLSVRELEKLIYTERKPRSKRHSKARPAQIISIEESLKRILATKVYIAEKRKGGRIIIEYYSSDELNRLLELLGLSESSW